MHLRVNDSTARPLQPTAGSFTARRYEERRTGGPNAHASWYTVRNDINGPILGPLLIGFFYIVIGALKHLPSLTLKRVICRMIGMKLGKNVTIASGVTLDYFFPELLEIGDNSIVGMDALLLTHEFLHDRWRKGKVTIGQNALIGARSTVMAGVTLGDDVTIAAMSLVNKCVPTGVVAGGIPIQAIRS